MIRWSVGLIAFVVLCVAHPLAQQADPAPKADARPSKPAVVVNLNTATAAELEQLPGIGAKVAARIVDYRTKKGRLRVFIAQPVTSLAERRC